MNRSTGLLRAYAALLLRVSGAEAVSLYAPGSGDGNPIFLCEGDPPLPEHLDVERAQRFAYDQGKRAKMSAECGQQPERIESAAPGWIIAVPCVPFGRASLEEDRRKSTVEHEARANEEDGEGLPSVWIGLRFEHGEEGRTRSDDAFRLLATGELSPTSGTSEHWASLFRLGGVLTWYARQISSIFDDPVTGLAGRAEFQVSLSHTFHNARDSGRPLALMLVNPDDFTAVNERFGHETGDRVLREIGERLRAVQRSSDSIAKYGGAIFASFLVDTDLGAARVVAEKVWGSLADMPYLEGTLRLGISLGVAVFESGDSGIDGHLELIRRADKALNAAKRYGGDHVAFWDPELESKDLGSVDRMTGVYTGNMSKDYRNMTLLSDTMTVVAGSTDVQDLVEQLVERLYSTLKADHVGIFEWDEEGHPVLLEGLSKHAIFSGANEAVRGLELGRRQMALIEDARREAKAMLVSFADDYSHRRIISFAVPLLVNDLCLGCLYLDGRDDTIALEGSGDLGFLRAFATQLAVALDRARLSEHQLRHQVREQQRLRAEVDDLRRALKHSKLVYRSKEMEALIDTARRVAPTGATVLVIGESGTGKELVARTIHELSPFREKPLVMVDCGAIPTTLIESELFGHERGAYTGAQERRIGRLLEAEGGTVVLDEIGELPLEVQSKLLRFVQERQVIPVGGTRVRHVDTRLIAVTNRELGVEAAAGRFREDLYYRLNVVRITVPPLRERPDDILHLARYFLEHFAGQYQKGSLAFSEEALASLSDHAWPGNVRELQNRIMQAVILCEGPVIGVRELELETLPADQTVELDVSGMKRSASDPEFTRSPSDERSVRERAAAPRTAAPPPLSPDDAWRALRIALRHQVATALGGGRIEPLPVGTWLLEDLVLEAYDAAEGVTGRARALLGIPETTFRRKLQKASSQMRAGLLTRRPPWDEMRPRIADLVRSTETAASDVLHTARSLLLTEVASQTDDPIRGAALMGITVRTYRRWMEELSELGNPSENDPRPMASVL
jgi:diguanylate cyclase (GGDEF)-like protein